MIYKKTCPNCGIEFKTDRVDQKFCCRKCSNSCRMFNAKSDYDKDLTWEKVPSNKNEWQCPYEREVSCLVRSCDKCGWNPEVAKARLEHYKAVHHG